MSVFRPDKMYKDVTCITPQEARSLGLEALLLDIDGTLMPTNQDELEPQVLGWLDAMKNAGIRLFILSNSKRHWRVQQLGQSLGIPCQWLAGKPRRRGFLAAAAQLGLGAAQIGMVGDQIFTDVLGANRCGMRSLLVESTDTDLWYQPLRRVFELPFMREK